MHARTDGEHAYGHLVGHRFPGSSYTLPEHVRWLWADAIGADPGETVAHPSLAYFVAMQGLGVTILEVFEMLDANPDSGVVMGEVELEFNGALTAGTTYECEAQVAGVDRKRGARVGVFDRLRSLSPCARPPPPTPLWAAPRRGSSPVGRPEVPHATELAAGQALEPYVVESVSPEPMKTMAAILQDPNPIHYDARSVRSLGLGDRPVNQGPSNLGYLIEMVVRFAGSPEALLSIRARFLGNVFAGERVECTGTVTAVDPGSGVAHIDLGAVSDGRPVLSGSATVALERTGT